MDKFIEFGLGEIESLVDAAKINSRRRQHLNLHHSHTESCQKVINAIHIDSYIAPHRHSLDPKVETLLALRGSFACFIFSNDGLVSDIVKFKSLNSLNQDIASFGIDVDPSAWHTIIALEPLSILLEIKEGPFNPSLAKEMAPWAPAEGSENYLDFLAMLKMKI